MVSALNTKLQAEDATLDFLPRYNRTPLHSTLKYGDWVQLERDWYRRIRTITSR